jgi:hypothetical protein
MRIRPDRLKPILRVEFVFIAGVISALLFTPHSWSQAPLYDVVQIDDASAVREEVVRQLDTFGRLVGKPPTHSIRVSMCTGLSRCARS